ncbi:aldo/keto reductase [Streptomyces sp. NPDC052107]|uniref:aldo/keto reductase n=1 Tax=Streptomyces sp. NPDC052107 TaxID=3155632 RepID=UPI003446212B
MQTMTRGSSGPAMTPVAYGTWQPGGNWGPMAERAPTQSAKGGLCMDGNRLVRDAGPARLRKGVEATYAEPVAQGLIRHVGVSLHTPAQRAEFATVPAYAPLAHGLLGGAILPDTTFDPDDRRADGPAFTGPGLVRNLDVVAALSAFPAGRDASVAEPAVVRVPAHPAVQAVLAGARTPAHLAQCLGAPHLHLNLAEIDHIMTAAVPFGGPSPEGMS